LLESGDFRVIAAGEAMVAFADNFPAAHQNGADHRIGTGSAGRLARQTASHA
jgi:hypothetical protein